MIGILLLLISIYLFNIKKFYGALMLFFLLVTNGFQIIPIYWLMIGGPLDKGTDLALLFILFVALKKVHLIELIIKTNTIYKWCLFLLIFTTASVFYSFLILKYPLTNILQVYRQYLIFLSFILFFVIPLPILKKAIHTLAVITIIQSFLFLLQIITGKLLLLTNGGTYDVTTSMSGNYIRYYNSPALLVPTFVYFLFVYKFKNTRFFYPIIILLLFTIIGPLHRSGIIAIIASLTVYTVLKKGKSIYLVGASILTILSSFIDIINKRIYETYLDLVTVFNSNLNLQNIDQTDNTMIFRIAHFLERFDYMIKQPFGWLFGIGLISDNSPLASRLPFKNGLISEVTGQVIKIDTGDLIYSPLFLTLGIMGTILYLFTFIKFLVYFVKNFRNSKYAVIGFITIVNAFFLSITSTEMLSNSFRLIVLLLSVMVYKQVALAKKSRYIEMPKVKSS